MYITFHPNPSQTGDNSMEKEKMFIQQHWRWRKDEGADVEDVPVEGW